MSGYNGDTVIFDGNTTSLTGSPAEVVTFKLAVKSYPKPAVFDWLNGISLSATREPEDDITVFDLSVTVANHASVYTVTGRNGDGGQLTSEIRIVVQRQGV